MWRHICFVLCSLALALQGALCVQAAERGASPRVLRTAWLGEHEAFPAWFAKKTGLDRQAGATLEMLRFATGADLVGEERAFDWLVGACGALPAVASNLSGDLEIIGIANDESMANAVLARADDPVFADGGAGSLPGVYGSAERVRGKTILCPRTTSAHYLLDRWLNALGLAEKDVDIRFMAPRKALGAFRSGYGDFLVLWSPELREALRDGLRVVARSDQCGAPQMILLVAPAKAAARSPEDVSAILRLYLQAAARLQAMPPQEVAALYRQFCHEWAGVELSQEEALEELRQHPMFTRQQQLELFGGNAPDSELGRRLAAVREFARRNGEPARDGAAARLNDAYLRAAE